MNIFHSKKKTIMSYVIITFGIFLYTFAWSAFLIPSQIIGGGVSGVSSILYFLSDESMPVGVTNLIINAVLVRDFHFCNKIILSMMNLWFLTQ